MTDKQLNDAQAAILLLAGFAMAVFLGYSNGLRRGYYKAKQEYENVVQTDTVWLKPDTIRIDRPVPVAKWLKPDTVFLPVPVQPKDSVPEQKPDTVYVPIPRETTYYAGNEYEAWVTGFKANLDSVHVFQKTAVVEKKVPVYVNKKWGIGLQAGVTYQKETKVTPYVGVGVSYNLFNF